MIDIQSLFTNLGFAEGSLFILKGVILVAEALYGLYAFIIVRQVSLMSETFKTEFSGLFKIISKVHLLVVMVVFLLSLLIL